MINNITGIILCGGRSSRMHSNKALLKCSDKTIIEIILNELKKVFSEILISTNNSKDFSFLNQYLVEDKYKDKGPLAGIHSALLFSNTEKNFITTCDLPLINSEIIQYLLNIKSEKEIIVPVINGVTEKLFGIYSKSVITKIEEIFSLSENDESIKASVYDLHNVCSVERVEIAELTLYNEKMFLNMNTPQDYDLIKNILESK